MKLNFKQICAWVLLTTLIGAPGFGALPPTTTKGQLDAGKTTTFNFEAPAYQITKTGSTTGLIETGSTNLLRNPSFEATTFSDGWTRTGAGTWTTGAALGLGVKSLSWDPSGPGETITGTAVTIPNSFRGKTGALVCQVQIPTGANNGDMVAWNGSAAIGAFASFEKILAGSSASTEVRTSFLFPTSGTITARFTSGSSEDPVLIDDCSLELDDRLYNGLISTPWVTSTITTSWANSTLSARQRRVGDTLELEYLITMTGAGSGTLQINLPSGLVIDTAKLAATGSNYYLDGNGSTFVAAATYPTYPRYQSTTAFNLMIGQTGSTYIYGSYITATAPSTYGVGNSISGIVKIPIVGWEAVNQLAANQQRTPTVTRLTSGSGTYTIPAGVTYLSVKMVGGGGGGAGSGTVTGTAAGAGGNSTFGVALLTANGGGAGPFGTGVGNGAAATVAAPAIGGGPHPGSNGSGSTFNVAADNNRGGVGGASCLGGSGGATGYGGPGVAAQTNSGSGGGGGGTSATVSSYSGGGGGAGGCILGAIIAAPAASYAYAVGAGGTAGGAGANGFAGGAGAAGYIEITEFYGYTVAILANSVSTGLAQGAKIVWAKVATTCTTSPCTITDQSGEIGAINRSSTGIYTVIFNAGTWTTPPTCTYRCTNASSLFFGDGAQVDETISLFGIGCFSSGATPADARIRLQCIGPR